MGTYYIVANVVDVETSKISASYNESANSSRDLKKACKKIVDNLTAK